MDLGPVQTFDDVFKLVVTRYYLLQVFECERFVFLVTVPQRNLTELQFLESVAEFV